MPYLISSFPEAASSAGFPDYTYSGSSTVVDTGETSGEWSILLTGTGTFTLNKKNKITIEAQGGGGGGGASNGVTVGSDGADGTIVTLNNRSLDAGTYEVTIGAAGSRGYSSAGYTGGTTTFGSLVTANGGAGGARAGGNRNQTHTSIYGNYGKGGLGGSTSQYNGSATYKYVYTASRYTYMYTQPSSINGWNEGSINAGGTVYLASNTIYDSNDGSSDKWYQTESGLYVSAANGSVSYQIVSDSRVWYGTAGTQGAILLKGKV